MENKRIFRPAKLVLRAEQIASTVKGVKSVKSNLVVKS